MERIQHYLKLDPEPAAMLQSDPQPTSWPSRGEIRFKNVSLRYRPDLPLILKGLSFTINPGEKVGIIGRTGAGKSSITQALFRMVEIEAGGEICIDGLNTKRLGVDTVNWTLNCTLRYRALTISNRSEKVFASYLRRLSSSLDRLGRILTLSAKGPIRS